jgi:branched-chain amino acid transport system ATP-binding protein
VNAVLEVAGLSVAFGGVRAVDNVSFEVAKGEIFSIIGPNGAGKTTVFNLISRLYDSTAGRVVFEGRDISRLAAHRVAAAGIARTFQNIELFENASVLKNLLLGRHSHRRSTVFGELLFLPAVRRQEIESRTVVEDVIDFLDLAHHRDALVSGLPYGVRKVVELGRALSASPRLLLLDEPSSGLNPEETEDLSHWIRDIRDDLGITVMMVEHDMTLVGRVSDRVMALNEGKVLAIGTSQAVQTDRAVVEAYLGS